MSGRFNWGTGIAMAYAAFAASTLAFVGFAMSRPVALVRPDYYAESLRQDQRMRAVANARALGPALSLRTVGGRRLILRLPAGQVRTAGGTITLYRASDAAADRTFALRLAADGVQEIALDGLAPGWWLAQVEWRASGEAFYLEMPVVVK